MRGRVGKIERLGKLRDRGVLSDIEFEAEKRRILGADRPRLDRYQPGSRKRRFVIAAGVAGVALIGALSAWLLARGDPQVASPAPSTVADDMVADSPSPEPLPSPSPDPVDVTEQIRFSDGSQCTFASVAENVFSRMLSWDQAASRWRSAGRISLGSLDLAAALKAMPVETVPGGKIYEASLRFPENTLWNGLRISRMIVRHGDYPDIDDFDSRSLTFLEEPQAVRKVLASLGVYVPLAPDFAELGGTESSCGGSMQIERIGGGSALVCGWGC